MPRLPYIPEYITVHLGAPDSNAENVTVPFLDYISNVASSELEHRCCITNHKFFIHFCAKKVEARDSAIKLLQLHSVITNLITEILNTPFRHKMTKVLQFNHQRIRRKTMAEFEKVADRIIILRRRLKENQADFAANCGVSTETISLIERQKTDIKLSTMQKIAAYTGLTVSELLDTTTPDLPQNFKDFKRNNI